MSNADIVGSLCCCQPLGARSVIIAKMVIGFADFSRGINMQGSGAAAPFVIFPQPVPDLKLDPIRYVIGNRYAHFKEYSYLNNPAEQVPIGGSNTIVFRESTIGEFSIPNRINAYTRYTAYDQFGAAAGSNTFNDLPLSLCWSSQSLLSPFATGGSSVTVTDFRVTDTLKGWDYLLAVDNQLDTNAMAESVIGALAYDAASNKFSDNAVDALFKAQLLTTLGQLTIPTTLTLPAWPLPTYLIFNDVMQDTLLSMFAPANPAAFDGKLIPHQQAMDGSSLLTPPGMNGDAPLFPFPPSYVITWSSPAGAGAARLSPDLPWGEFFPVAAQSSEVIAIIGCKSEVSAQGNYSIWEYIVMRDGTLVNPTLILSGVATGRVMIDLPDVIDSATGGWNLPEELYQSASLYPIGRVRRLVQ